MREKIYFDNNATTRIDDEVLNAMMPYLKEQYGNPSSSYSFGKDIKKVINDARNKLAGLINAEDNEIVFTSCASESNTTAIMSAIKTDLSKKHIITTQVEHASILETMKYLESIGYYITYIPVDKQGRININDIRNAITDNTILISVMMANNEIGNIYPIQEIGKIAKEHNILFHTDAVQAVGKINIDVKSLNIDMASFSGHKIHAPKGIGSLYIRNNTTFSPLIYGHQEKERRGGTENVPYIVGIGKAAELFIDNNIKILRDKIEDDIKNNIEDYYIYGDLDNRLSNTLSIAFKGVKAEELMLMLEAYNIYVSTGSACNSESAEPSHVLIACNADLDNYSPIRISLGKYNTEEEVNFFVKSLISIINTLRKRG
ncbi:MAG TPA: aminotransferase class V-fold PLP-dependent enzyme [Bacilli bacterium]|nr:aminotransferase class V-fold PLP-dependent enzyme [Bacilli bacterium]